MAKITGNTPCARFRVATAQTDGLPRCVAKYADVSGTRALEMADAMLWEMEHALPDALVSARFHEIEAVGMGGRFTVTVREAEYAWQTVTPTLTISHALTAVAAMIEAVVG